MSRAEKKARVKPIKKVPLITGIVFLGIGVLNLVYFFIATDKSSYAAMVATFITLGQFNLKDGDRLDWSLKAEGGEMVIVVKPTQK